MTAPRSRVRDETFKRDGYECVAGPIGCFGQLEWGHREATGQGGRGAKAPLLVAADGIAQCARHNQAAEGSEQARALELGWKLKRFRGNPPIPARDIPYFVVRERQWYLPGDGADRLPVSPLQALDLLIAAESLNEQKLIDQHWEVQQIRSLGYIVAMLAADPVRIGAIVSRYELTVMDPETSQLIGVFRCTREGEWLGGGWVETPAGTRAVSHFPQVKALLVERRDAATSREPVGYDGFGAPLYPHQIGEGVAERGETA